VDVVSDDPAEEPVDGVTLEEASEETPEVPPEEPLPVEELSDDGLDGAGADDAGSEDADEMFEVLPLAVSPLEPLADDVPVEELESPTDELEESDPPDARLGVELDVTPEDPFEDPADDPVDVPLDPSSDPDEGDVLLPVVGVGNGAPPEGVDTWFAFMSICWSWSLVTHTSCRQSSFVVTLSVTICLKYAIPSSILTP